jgi:DNA-binding response OmpR family regulator
MNTILDTPGTKIVLPPARSPPIPSPRILVVEDDGDIRRLNAQVLFRSGYQVDAAEDGAAGWEALHANNFDLLITDHDMPKLTGLELVKMVRTARMTLPVILASGSLHEEELSRHPWLQLAATLLKPFYPDQLLVTVKEVLRAAGCVRLGPEGCGTVLGNSFRHRLPYQQWDKHDCGGPRRMTLD